MYYIRMSKKQLINPNSYCKLPLLLAMFMLALSGLTACGKQQPGLDNYSTTKARPASGGDAVVQTARTQTGKRYKFGGTTPQTGFDCSGFVCWSYSQHGYALPRNSKEQMSYGQPIKKTELKPGDLVVFKPPRRRGGLHTGIYTGNGNFIHSPSTGDSVREDSLQNPYWEKYYVTARRIIQ